MGIEVIAFAASYFASVFAFGVFIRRALVRMFEQFSTRIEQQFVSLDGQFHDRFETLDGKTDDRFETLDRRIDEKIQPIEAKVDKLDGKVDELAKDHQSLARQLAEFRGEVRGRLGELTGPDPQQAPA